MTQPWATLVAVGAKRIETRSWTTSYRGPIVIHAAAGLGPVGGIDGLVDLLGEEAFVQALAPHVSGYTTEEVAANLPRGAIVAAGKLDDVVPTLDVSWVLSLVRGEYHDGDRAAADREIAFGDYTPGRYAWLLADVLPLQPIETRGAMGLWTLRDDEALADLLEVWDPTLAAVTPDDWAALGATADLDRRA